MYFNEEETMECSGTHCRDCVKRAQAGRLAGIDWEDADRIPRHRAQWTPMCVCSIKRAANNKPVLKTSN